jgi:putative transposase
MKERKEMVNSTHKLSIRQQCILLCISLSSKYYKPKGESPVNLAIMEKIDRYHLDEPSHGVLRTQDYLADIGYKISESRVRRLLRLMGIQCVYPGPNLSRLGQAKYIHPYLLRNLSIVRPNQVWAIDITYIPMRKGFLYLTAIIDIYSRFVVGWTISNSLAGENCLEVLREAINRYGKPEIINSDQGSQFTCEAWIEELKNQGIQISMDGKGRAIDNIYIERLWRSVKYDYVYLNPPEDGDELFNGLMSYFEKYNFRFKHQGIGRVTPASLFQYPVAA